jgi:hypothetical protein
VSTKPFAEAIVTLLASIVEKQTPSRGREVSFQRWFASTGWISKVRFSVDARVVR